MQDRPEQLDQLGVVLGTEAAAPLEFHFAVREGRKVQLDEIVAVTVADPADATRTIEFYGVVDAVTRRLEGVQFDGDTELVAEGLLPAHVSYVARVRTTRVEPEEFVPPAPGDPVFLARGATLAKALFVDQMERPLPAGVLRNGESAFINLDFVDGTKGAHINISGISGVATKTSYALFLLYSLFNSRDGNGELLLGDAANSRAVIFNVKGRDLFYLDKPNTKFQEREQQWLERSGFDVDRYERLGLPSSPFSSLEIRSPAIAGSKGGDLLAEEQDDPRIQPYCWSLLEFAADGLMPFMLSGHSDTSGLGFLIDNVTSRLQGIAGSQKGKGPYLLVEPWQHVNEREGGGQRIGDDETSDLAGQTAEELGGSKVRLETLFELVEFIEYKLLLENEGRGNEGWTARQPRGTCEALVRRLRGASRHTGRLVRGDVSAEKLARARPSILDSGSQIHVIDIHSLPQVAQMFTVGVLLRNVFERRETGSDSGKVFIVLDELNKYAPAEGDSPIKEVMLDIAERGRSLGVILIGAQQTASEVERRVVSNAAVRVSGRLDSAEAERSEYRYLASMRQRATILTPGTMVINQPDVPAPVLVTFPFPSWATRREEALLLPDPDELEDLLD